MLDNILNKDHLILFIVCFISLVIFTGILKSLLYAVIIVIIKYLFDKYLYAKAVPYIDKFVDWIKNFKK